MRGARRRTRLGVALVLFAGAVAWIVGWAGSSSSRSVRAEPDVSDVPPASPILPSDVLDVGREVVHLGAEAVPDAEPLAAFDQNRLRREEMERRMRAQRERGGSPRVPFRGAVRVPAAWGTDEMHLRVGGASANLNPVDGLPQTYDWRTLLVKPGLHELVVVPLGYSEHVNVPDAGLSDVFIDVPEPCDVAVHVLEEPSGLPAEIDSISWHWSSSDEHEGRKLTVFRAKPGGPFTFRAPAGHLQIAVWSDGYRPLEHAEWVARGVNELTLSVHRHTSFVLVVKDGDDLLPWNGGTLDFVDSPGTVRGVSTARRGRRYTVTEAGWYRFSYEREGYRPVELQAVLVEADRQVEHVIELERAE